MVVWQIFEDARRGLMPVTTVLVHVFVSVWTIDENHVVLRTLPKCGHPFLQARNDLPEVTPSRPL